MLRGDAGRALLLVPETGLGHGAFEVCEANPESLRVKGTHGPRRAGSRSPRAGAPRTNGRPWEWMVAGGRPEPIERYRGARLFDPDRDLATPLAHRSLGESVRVGPCDDDNPPSFNREVHVAGLGEHDVGDVTGVNQSNRLAVTHPRRDPFLISATWAERHQKHRGGGESDSPHAVGRIFDRRCSWEPDAQQRRRPANAPSTGGGRSAERPTPTFAPRSASAARRSWLRPSPKRTTETSPV